MDGTSNDWKRTDVPGTVVFVSATRVNDHGWASAGAHVAINVASATGAIQRIERRGPTVTSRCVPRVSGSSAGPCRVETRVRSAGRPISQVCHTSADKPDPEH